MAVADIFLACPITILGIVLVFASPRWGYYLLAWVSFWFVWANIVTTATSLRFEKPKITLSWPVVFPSVPSSVWPTSCGPWSILRLSFDRGPYCRRTLFTRETERKYGGH